MTTFFLLFCLKKLIADCFQVLEKFFDEEDGDSFIDCDDDGVDVFGSRVYDEDSDSEMSDTFRWEFHQHKKDYYRNKMEYGKVTELVYIA